MIACNRKINAHTLEPKIIKCRNYANYNMHKMNKARTNKRTTDWDAYKRLRHECTNKVHYAKSRFYRNLLNDNTENPRKFWSAIKSIYTTETLKSGSSNTTSNQHSGKVSIFSQYFNNAIKPLKQLSIPLVNFTWKYNKRLGIRTVNKFSMTRISKSFVESKLRLLKRNKCTGLDNLPIGLLKDCATYISKPLRHIVLCQSCLLFPRFLKT